MKAEVVLEGIDDVENLKRALLPEIGEGVPHTEIDIVVDDDKLKVVIEADDISSLRAALNSYLRWLNLAQEVQESTRRD